MTAGVEGATGIWWLEARVAAQHPARHRTAHDKELSAQDIHSAEAEEPWSMLGQNK